MKKKKSNKRHIQSLKPIFLFNIDVKLICKTLAERLENVVPEKIFSNDNAYVKKRCISDGGKLISDLLEISHVLNKKDF